MHGNPQRGQIGNIGNGHHENFTHNKQLRKLFKLFKHYPHYWNKTQQTSSPDTVVRREPHFSDMLWRTTTQNTCTHPQTNHKPETIINLSNFTLNADHLALLGKGLTYIPTNNRHPIDTILTEQDRFIRRIMLSDYFDDNNEDPFDPKDIPFKRRFIDKSTWKPKNKDLSSECKETIRAIQTSTSSILWTSTTINGNIITQHKQNLSKAEWAALQQLKNNTDIIIKPADKGGNIVILNRQDYINEGLRQLSDQNYYKELDQPIYKSNIKTLRTLITALYTDNAISHKQLQYLLPTEDNTRPRQFYLLPKIHKNRQSWPTHTTPPGRPIVSDVQSESYRISEFLDFFLLPLSITHKSYIKDTYDFVQKINNIEIKPTTILFTADVTSLYTNMDLRHTLNLVKRAFKLHPDPIRPDFHLLKLLEFTLYNNDFMFNEKPYLQTRGIPMGKKYAPALANLYMAEYDDLLTSRAGTNIGNYFRFLDDLFGTFDGPPNILLDLFKELNNIIPGITITPTLHTSHIDFLDTTIYKQTFNNITTLRTTIYFKPTATHQLLHKQSFHPQHTHKGVLKSQIVRFSRICSNRLQFDSATELLFQTIKERGYRRRWLTKMRRAIWDEQFEKDTNTTTSSSQQLQTKEKAIPMVLPFSGMAQKLLSIWKKNISENQGPHLKTIKAYKNNKSLRHFLIRSRIQNPVPKQDTILTTHPSLLIDDINPETLLQDLINLIDRQDELEKIENLSQNQTLFNIQTINNKVTRCTSTKCTLCATHIKETSTITSTTNRKTFKITNNLNCNSKNIIYVITCAKCGLQYVGETGRLAKDRLTDHRSAIRTHKETPIGIHFNLPGHKITDLIFTPIETLDSNDTQNRREREKFWCQRLDSYFPKGLNNLPT